MALLEDSNWQRIAIADGIQITDGPLLIVMPFSRLTVRPGHLKLGYPKLSSVHHQARAER